MPPLADHRLRQWLSTGPVFDYFLLRPVTPVAAAFFKIVGNSSPPFWYISCGEFFVSTALASGLRTSWLHTDDATIFDLWVEEHGSDLYRLAYRLSGDCGGAEDLVQEAFFEVWKYRSPEVTGSNPVPAIS